MKRSESSFQQLLALEHAPRDAGAESGARLDDARETFPGSRKTHADPAVRKFHRSAKSDRRLGDAARDIESHPLESRPHPHAIVDRTHRKARLAMAGAIFHHRRA